MPQGLLVNLGLMVGAAAFAILTSVSHTAALATAAGLVLCAGAARRLQDVPMAALVLILAMVPVDYMTKIDGGALTVTKILFPAAFAVLVMQRIVSGRAFAWSSMATLVLGFALTVTCSFLTNGTSPFAVAAMQGYVGVLLLFFFVLSVLEHEGQVRVLLVALVCSCLLSAAIGMVGLLLGRLPSGIVSLMAPHAMRLVGLSSVNPNAFGSYVLTALLIAGYFMAVDRRPWARVALIPVVLLTGMAVVMTRSRVVSFVAVAATLLLIVRLRHRIAPWKTGAVIAVAVGILLWMAPHEYFERIQSVLTNPAMDQALQSRQSFNVVALKLFAEHPLLGVGPGNFSEQFNSQDFRYVADTFGHWKMVHNVFLSIACHMGIVGLALFAAIVWRAFADLNEVLRSYAVAEDGFLKRCAEALQVALCAFLLNMAFLPAERDKYLWILFGVCSALARIRQTQLTALRSVAAEAGSGSCMPA